MSFLAWILLGLVSGFIASKVVDGRGKGLVMNLVLGVVGAFVGGGLLHLFGRAGVTGFNLWSVCVAVIGSVLTLAVYHASTSGLRQSRRA